MTQKRFDLEQIRRKVDLRALAEEAGAVFTGSGNSSKCPLHGGDNPTAFHLYSDSQNPQRWHCFTNCPEGDNDGDVITFYMRWQGVEFTDACLALSERAGIPVASLPARRPRPRTPDGTLIPPPPAAPTAAWGARAWDFVNYARDLLQSDVGDDARRYLHEERGLADTTIDAWHLGYNPRPIFDNPAKWGLNGGKKIWLPRGIVIPGVGPLGYPFYIKVRRPLPDDPLADYLGGPVKDLPKVKFGGPRGARATLYGADHLKDLLPILLLTEGEWDALLAWRVAADLTNVMSLGGAKHRADLGDLTAFTRFPATLAVYDPDEAGQQGAAVLAGIPRVTAVRPPGGDLTDYYNAAGGGPRGVMALREWIAGIVAETLERLLDDLDRQHHAPTYTLWLALYEHASAVLA